MFYPALAPAGVVALVFLYKVLTNDPDRSVTVVQKVYPKRKKRKRDRK